MSCDVTTGTPVEVAAGATTSGIDFAVGQGGLISGTVTEMGSGIPIEGVHVDIFDINGDFQTFGATDANGSYTIYNTLPAGSYFARAWGEAPHIGELYENVPAISAAMSRMDSRSRSQRVLPPKSISNWTWAATSRVR